MDYTVRLMELAETDVVIAYFHDTAPEYLHAMGIDPALLPDRESWRARIVADFAKPITERERILVAWLRDGEMFGFSSCSDIVHGDHAFMHLHVLDTADRARGGGTACVRQSAQLYVALLGLKQLYCQPYAFNTAPHRALQAAGFKFIKTY